MDSIFEKVTAALFPLMQNAKRHERELELFAYCGNHAWMALKMDRAILTTKFDLDPKSDIDLTGIRYYGVQYKLRPKMNRHMITVEDQEGKTVMQFVVGMDGELERPEGHLMAGE